MATHTIATATAQSKPITFSAVGRARDHELLDWLEFVAGEIRLHVEARGVYPQHLHQSRARLRFELLKRAEGS